MPTVAKQPRDLVTPRGGFGRNVQVAWRQPTTLDELVDLRRAEMQHACCVETREYLIRERITHETFAGRCGIEVGRFGRGLNGERWFAIEDLIRITSVTGFAACQRRYKPTPLTHPVLVGEYPNAVLPPSAATDCEAS